MSLHELNIILCYWITRFLKFFFVFICIRIVLKISIQHSYCSPTHWTLNWNLHQILLIAPFSIIDNTLRTEIMLARTFHFKSSFIQTYTTILLPYFLPSSTLNSIIPFPSKKTSHATTTKSYHCKKWNQKKQNNMPHLNFIKYVFIFLNFKN